MRRRIITSRYRQRGNIVFVTGLPPTAMEPVAGDAGPGWSLIQEWDAGIGDIVAIDAAFSSAGGFAGLVWNPAGTLITLCSTGDDTVKTFECSVPWDPDTATEVATRAITNPRIMGHDGSGNRLFINVFIGDKIENYPFAGYTIGAGAITSDITKANVGFGGSADGSTVIGPFGDYLLWAGQVSSGADESLKYITTPGGDLDIFNVVDTHQDLALNPSLSFVFSPLTADEKFWWEGSSSASLRPFTLTTAKDVTTLTIGAFESLAALTALKPVSVWFNPLDTREVWIQGSEGADMTLARFATNVPET